MDDWVFEEIILPIFAVIIMIPVLIIHRKRKIKKIYNANEKVLEIIKDKGFIISKKVDVLFAEDLQNSFIFCIDNHNNQFCCIRNNNYSEFMNFKSMVDYTVLIREKGTDIERGKKKKINAVSWLSLEKNEPILNDFAKNNYDLSEICINIEFLDGKKHGIFPEPLFSDLNGADITKIIELEKMLWNIIKTKVSVNESEK